MKIMKQFFCSLAIILFLCTNADAQDKKAKTTLKTDVLNFRNQVVRSKEYLDEKKKIPARSKQYGAPVKITVEIDVDTTGEDDEVTDPADNILTGYIMIAVSGANAETIPAYTLHFDRATRRIIDMKNELENTDQDAKSKDLEK